MSSLGSGKRPQNPDGGKNRHSPSFLLVSGGRGSSGGHPPPPTHPQRASPAAPRPPDLRSPAGASAAAGARAERAAAPAPRPPPPLTPRRSPRGADSAHTARRTRSRVPLRPPPPRTRRLWANGGGGARRVSRAPSRLLGAWRPQADKGASWQPC